MKQTVCLNCNVPFTQGRTDQMFCSDKCGSAYWKLHGTTHNHKDLPHFNAKECKQCGNQFWYNDYAERKGKRVPTFCSTRCRVRHHRGVKENERKFWEAFQKASEKHEPKARPFKTGDFRDSLHVPRRWDHVSARRWLGVPDNADYATSQKAFRDLNRRFHPDANKGVEWPHLKIVNAAFDYLKRNREI